jgi:MraZ protein
MAFRGKYNFSIDEKGRVNIPSKFRKVLAPEAEDTFVIIRAPGGCLRAYPKDEWEKYERFLASMPVNPDTDRYQRMLQSTLSDSKLDRQGRVSLTTQQMEIAGIEKDLCIVGRINYLEIWNTRRFEESFAGEEYDAVYYKTHPDRRVDLD